MNNETLNTAAIEAQRFLRAINSLKSAEEGNKASYYTNPKETGALRRASMDLTRALAQMRKPV